MLELAQSEDSERPRLYVRSRIKSRLALSEEVSNLIDKCIALHKSEGGSRWKFFGTRLRELLKLITERDEYTAELQEALASFNPDHELLQQ